MRGERLVSPDSREAVLRAAEALGYRPNAVARSLVQRRSYSVGVLVSDLHNLFFAEVVDGIKSVAGGKGYRILIATGDQDAGAEEETLEMLLEQRSDGLILLGPRCRPLTIAAAGRAVPVAVVGSATRVTGVDLVVNDDFKGAELAVEHLVSLGHRRIALIDGGAAAGASERHHGYRAAMDRHGLSDLVQVAAGDFTEAGGFRGATELLALEPRPTAIFAGNDVAALGALDAIDRAGLRVPEDISLVGYDNTSLAALLHISLTTIHQPRRRIGEMAMEAVLHRIEHRNARVRQVILEPELVIRETTAPPAAGARAQRRPG